MSRFTGQCVVVTGGGIGEATARGIVIALSALSRKVSRISGTPVGEGGHYHFSPTSERSEDSGHRMARFRGVTFVPEHLRSQLADSNPTGYGAASRVWQGSAVRRGTSSPFLPRIGEPPRAAR